MLKIYFTICSTFFLLTSCTLSNNETPQIQKPNIVPTQVDIIGNQGNEKIESKTTQEVRQELPTVMPLSSGSKKYLTIEDIDAITSFDQLRQIDPLNIDSSKRDDKKYLDFQKNTLKFNILLSEIKEPEYIQLGIDERKILEGREIWTEGIKKLDEEYTSAFFNTSLSGVMRNEIVNKRKEAIEIFKLTQAYIDYIELNKKKLETINLNKEKFYNLEILKIREEIRNYSK